MHRTSAPKQKPGTFEWRTASWPLAAIGAIAAPLLISPSLPPSPTFINQTLALFAWGFWLVLLAAVLPQRSTTLWPAGLRSLLAAFAILIAAAIASPLWTALPTSLSLSAVALLYAAAVTAIAGTAMQQAGHGSSVFRALCIALLVAGLASAAIAIVQVYAPHWADGYWVADSANPGRATGNIRQSNHLCTLLLWSIAAAVWLGEVRVLRHNVATGLALLMMFAVVLSASRTGLVGAMLLALWGLLDRRLGRSARVMLLLAPVAYGLLWVGAAAWAHQSQTAFAGEARLTTTSNLLSSRFGVWANTLALICMHPWVGVGFGEFNFAWSLTEFPDRPAPFFDHTHNLPLQFLVELGLPMGAGVLTLLGYALWCAGRNCSKPSPSDAVSSPLRAALFMVLLAMVHSFLEHPLWFAYFLLPTAFAFGLCLGGPAAGETARPGPHRTTGPSFKLRPAALVLLLGTAFSVYDYHRISALTSAKDNAAPLVERIAAARSSVFYGHHAEYAMTLVSKDDLEVLFAAQHAAHIVLDAHLLQAWAMALSATGDTERAKYLAQRLKEFRHQQSEPFFAPCNDPGVAAENKPFQCTVPQRRFTFADFR